jgi:hypothetical protein
VLKRDKRKNVLMRTDLSYVYCVYVRVLSFVIFSSFCFLERDEMKGAVESGFWISKCVCLTVHIAMARAGRRIIW